MRDVTVVIVNWNTKDLLLQCLRSIRTGISRYTYDVFVIDNASEEDCSSLFRRKQFSSIKFIQNKVNVGFAKANNQALKQVKTKYVLILNPDTVLQPLAIDVLVNFLDNNQSIGACGPKLLNLDGSDQGLGYYRRLPSITQTLLFYTDLYRWCIKNRYLVNIFWESNIESNEPIEVDQIPGTCMLVRLDVLRRVGFFDEDFPIWLEDVYLCYQLSHAGCKLVYNPQAKIYHVGGASFDKWDDRINKESRFWLSMFIYFRKTHNFATVILVKTIMCFNFVFRIISRSIMQIYSYNADREKFILLEKEILLNIVKNKIIKNP